MLGAWQCLGHKQQAGSAVGRIAVAFASAFTNHASAQQQEQQQASTALSRRRLQTAVRFANGS